MLQNGIVVKEWEQMGANGSKWANVEMGKQWEEIRSETIVIMRAINMCRRWKKTLDQRDRNSLAKQK